jgi:hypothetical protein
MWKVFVKEILSLYFGLDVQYVFCLFDARAIRVGSATFPLKYCDSYEVYTASDSGASTLICQNGTSMLHPRMLCPPTIWPRTLYPDIFTSPYVLSLNCWVHSVPEKKLCYCKCVRFVPEFIDCVNF